MVYVNGFMPMRLHGCKLKLRVTAPLVRRILQQVPKYSITAMTPNMMEPFEFTGRYGGVVGDEADNIYRI